MNKEEGSPVEGDEGTMRIEDLEQRWVGDHLYVIVPRAGVLEVDRRQVSVQAGSLLIASRRPGDVLTVQPKTSRLAE